MRPSNHFLKPALLQEDHQWADFAAFSDDPLAVWVELSLGIELPANEAPRRAKPMTLADAAHRLADDAQCTLDEARAGLQRFLVAAHEVKTPQGRAPFAFKLHQFISGPGKVLATLEPEGIRHITLDAQRYAPGRQDEGTQLYPVHFCRDCGQEYHPVWRSGQAFVEYAPREIDDISSDDDENARYGFLCPAKLTQVYRGSIEDLPESWLDLTKAEPKVKSTFRKYVPEDIHVSPQGLQGHGGGEYWFIPGKFRFCLNCGQTHEVHGKDINRLASLSGEGRSSATTILTLSAIRQLFATQDLPADQPDPRKLLGFTDNRQDAALQAGHFNDFVFLLTLRSALIGALQNHQGLLTEETLADAVFKALGFDKTDFGTLAEYLRTPKLMGLARQDAQRTMRFIIGYRLLRDLRRGWRFNNPNLDQLNLLTITYRGMDEFSNESSLFTGHPILASISPAQRATLAGMLFDSMRRSLCLETRYLDPVEQDKAKATAHQYLNERWAFASDENLETSKSLILTKRPEYRGKPRTDLIPGGSRSRLLKDIKSAKFWKDSAAAAQVTIWKDPQWVELVEHLLQAASHYGYVHKSDVEGAPSAGASTPPAWTGCWSMSSRPLKTASTTSSSAASTWAWRKPCASRTTPCSTLKRKSTPRKSMPHVANCWSSAFATPRKTAKTGSPTPCTKPRWSACLSCSARPPWSWASIFRPSTRCTCATCPPPPPTTPSAVAGPGARGSKHL